MFSVALQNYRLVLEPADLPSSFEFYAPKARLVDQIDMNETEGAVCFVAAGLMTEDWPRLVVVQRYWPAGYGFEPGALVAEDTHTLFLGAGTRLLAYRLEPLSRLWEDYAECGFWGWSRHGSVVLMSAELELAAWTADGVKLWSTFVEPPWTYAVEGDRLTVDVMGDMRTFPLRQGPDAVTPPAAPEASA
jgi:hypothetical protein